MLKRGDQVEILPEFQDAGDDEFHWVVLADEEKGRVDICPVDIALRIKPRYTVESHQIRLCQFGGEGTGRTLLSPEEIELVIARNAAEKDPNICHSHDFCDANVVLLDVFLAHGMDPADEGGMEKWGNLWDETWTLAKTLGFDLDQPVQSAPKTAP